MHQNLDYEHASKEYLSKCFPWRKNHAETYQVREVCKAHSCPEYLLEQNYQLFLQVHISARLLCGTQSLRCSSNESQSSQSILKINSTRHIKRRLLKNIGSFQKEEQFTSSTPSTNPRVHQVQVGSLFCRKRCYQNTLSQVNSWLLLQFHWFFVSV